MRDSTFCSNPVSNNLRQGLPNGIVTLLGKYFAEHIGLVNVELRIFDLFSIFRDVQQTG